MRNAGVPRERLMGVYRDLLERLRREPGFAAVAQVRNVPIGGSFSNRDIVIDGVKQQTHTNFNAVSDRYFETMGAALVAGRDFDVRDAAGAPRVAIVSEAFARTYFNGANPLGRRFQIEERPGQPRPEYTIVGLTRDSKYSDIRDPFEPLMFVPFEQDPQQPFAYVRFVVRSTQPLVNVTGAVVGVLHQQSPAAIVKFRTMEGQVRDSLVRERLMATLSGLFGVLAAIIAAIGLYGVMSYTVARRRNEIGIRMALGARRGEVVAMVLREAGVLLAIGLAVGTVAALGAARLAASLLFGLTPHDPATIVTAASAMALVAAAASGVPALRASRLDPTEALRDE